MDEFQVFKAPVDFVAYPDYCKAIAYPMCLESIQERLSNHYYRRSRAVQFDIELLENNALTYNDPKSNIAMYAKHISRIFKTSIANHYKPLPAHVSVKNSRKDEDDEFDGSGSENELVDIESEPEPEFDDDLLVDEEDDNAFLDDDESSNDESRTSSRSRVSQRRSTSSRAARSTRKTGTNGSSRKKQNGSGSSSGRGRGRRGRPRKVEENQGDDDNDDDGEWGKPRTNGSRRGRRSHAGGADNDGDEEDYAQAGGSNEDSNDGMDDFKESVSSRPSRNKRKKTRIVDSDSDFV
ncbi:Bromodomain and WD repeat-containing protein 1 [Entomortierella beljakovae]|nr:Bromodomain and WD repeat-containing protein 1 [Entomortierella beljakovae]